jgi:hypothetical protein
MDMLSFYRLVEADQALVQTLQSVDGGLCATYGDVLTKLFREIVIQEHRNPRQFEALKHAFAATARGAVGYLDHIGVTAAVGQVAPLLQDVSFADSTAFLAYEAACLYRLGVPHAKIAPFWAYLDHHKSAILPRMAQPGFALQALVDPAVSGFGHEKGGEPWQHLSPGWWTTLGGAILVVVNLAAEAPSFGLATASVVAGVVGVGAGAADAAP